MMVLQHGPAARGEKRHRTLRLRLISDDEVILTDREVAVALRHRNSLLFFTAVVGFLVLLGVRDEARDFPAWQNALFFGTVQLMAAVGICGMLRLMRYLRPGPEVLTLHLSPFVGLAALMMVVASEATVALTGGPPLASPFEYAVLWFLFYALGEIQAVLLCTGVAPAILRDIRSRPDLPLAAPPAPDAAAGDAALVIGDLRLDPATIRHVRAEGNYVDIRTDSSRHFLLTTFATVLAALDPAQGRQVHRSHWVAARVVTGFFRDGRDIVIRLEDGTEIHVAQSRQKDVLPWLESVSVRVRAEDVRAEDKAA